jgi:hypothetical protein
MVRKIERALLTGVLASVLSHGIAASVGAVEVPRPDRLVAMEAPDRRAWQACRTHGERTLPVVQVDVAEADGAGLAGVAVIVALTVREHQVRAFTTTCMRAAGFSDASDGVGAPAAP